MAVMSTYLAVFSAVVLPASGELVLGTVFGTLPTVLRLPAFFAVFPMLLLAAPVMNAWFLAGLLENGCRWRLGLLQAGMGGGSALLLLSEVRGSLASAFTTPPTGSFLRSAMASPVLLTIAPPVLALGSALLLIMLVAAMASPGVAAPERSAFRRVGFLIDAGLFSTLSGIVAYLVWAVLPRLLELSRDYRFRPGWLLTLRGTIGWLEERGLLLPILLASPLVFAALHAMVRRRRAGRAPVVRWQTFVLLGAAAVVASGIVRVTAR
jgi:hypothetical protein